MPKPTLVSQRSAADIERHHLQRAFNRALVALSANLLRVIRGTGKPDLIMPQALAVAQAGAAYVLVAGEAPAANLRVNQDDPERWRGYPQWDQDMAAAQEQILAGALQIVASRLLGQKTIERAGELQLHEGKKAWEAAVFSNPSHPRYRPAAAPRRPKRAVE